MNPHTSHTALRDELDATTFNLDVAKKFIFNTRYNSWIADHCDKGQEKAIPYIGWYWRDADFYDGYVPIGDCGELIGVMMSNKWGYDSRNLTNGEVDTFLSYIDHAMKVERECNGANADNAEGVVDVALKALYDWMQTLKVSA